MTTSDAARRLWTRLLSLPEAQLPPLETMGMPKTHSQSDLAPREPSTTGTLIVYGSTLKSCALCLEDYRSGDRLRILEPCAHAYHASCVDTYFSTGLGAVCPVCKRGVARPRFDASSSTASQQDQTSDSRIRWENVRLIDVDVHQGWIEWLVGLLRIYSTRASTSPS